MRPEISCSGTPHTRVFYILLFFFGKMRDQQLASSSPLLVAPSFFASGSALGGGFPLWFRQGSQSAMSLCEVKMDLAVGFLCDFLSGFLTWRRCAISSWLSQPAVGRLVLLNFIFWPPKIIPWHVFKTFPSSFLGAFRGTSSKIIPWHVLAHSVARLQKS